MTIIHDTQVRTKEERAELFRALRELKRACGKNKHDQITTLIDALLDEGIDTKPRIIGALQKLDFSASQVAAVLDDEVNRRRWRRHGHGQYARTSHDLPTVSEPAFAQPE